MAVSDVFEWTCWLNHILPYAQSIFFCFGYIFWQWTGLSCSPFCWRVLQTKHCWHIVGVEFWRALCLEIDGVILTFLSCKFPSNLSLHKDLPHFPGHFSAIYFSGMSTPVINRLCQNRSRLMWITEMSIEFCLLFGFNSKLFVKEDTERFLHITRSCQD